MRVNVSFDLELHLHLNAQSAEMASLTSESGASVLTGTVLRGDGAMEAEGEALAFLTQVPCPPWGGVGVRRGCACGRIL